MVSTWMRDRVERAENFDYKVEQASIKEAHPQEDHYPFLVGAMAFRCEDAAETARILYDELVKAERRKDALEWAAEHCLNEEDVSTHDGGEVYTLLYAVADVIEHALANGMTDNTLRTRLRSEIQEDEIAKGRFIDTEERCKDCDEFVGEPERCETCQEIHEEAVAQS